MVTVTASVPSSCKIYTQGNTYLRVFAGMPAREAGNGTIQHGSAHHPQSEEVVVSTWVGVSCVQSPPVACH